MTVRSILFVVLTVLASLFLDSLALTPNDGHSRILKERMMFRDDFVKQLTVPDPQELHDVVIHTKYHNLDVLEDIVHNELTNPLHSRYRKWLTFEQVKEITNHLPSNQAIEEWLQPHASEIEMKWTANNHFLQLRAPVRVLEHLFSTTFYHWVDNQPLSRQRRAERKTQSYDKSGSEQVEVVKQAEHYSIPHHLEEHIHSVSNICHPPLVVHQNSVIIDPEDPQYKSKRQGQAGQEEQEHSFTSLFHSVAANVLPPSLHSQISISPQIDSGATHSGYVDVSFLKSYYQIYNNRANSTHRQSVFETNSEYFSRSDLSSFQSTYNLVQQAAVDIGGYALNGTACSLDSNDNPYRSCNEGNLDIQYIMGMAQNAVSIYWYNSGTSGNAFNDWIVDVSNDANPPWSNSISWGATEQRVPNSQKDTFCNTALTLVGQGVSISVASGDNGASGTGNSESCGDATSCAENSGYSPSFPATCPYVTAVGATMGPEAGVPERACQSDYCYDSSYPTMGGVITSGGGFSTYFSRPSWQDDAIANWTTQIQSGTSPASGYNTNGRGIPDLSMIGVRYKVVIAGTTQWLFGTSASTPVFAAIVTLINSLRTETNHSSNSTASYGPIGWINKNIYQAHSNITSYIFNDIKEGDNKCCSSNNCNEAECCETGFYTAPGWDPVTGWGSVNYIQFAEFFETAPQLTPDPLHTLGISTLQQIEIYITIVVLFLVCCALPAAYFSWRNYKHKQTTQMIMARNRNGASNNPLHTGHQYDNSPYGNNNTPYRTTQITSPSRGNPQSGVNVNVDVIPTAVVNAQGGGYRNTPIAIAQPMHGSQGDHAYQNFSKPVASNNETQCPGCGLHIEDPVRLVEHASMCHGNQPPSYDDI